VVVTPLAVMAWPWLEVSIRGVGFGVASGALASGLGYAVWYRALGRLSLTPAALVQLAVPVITAVGGVIFIAETVTPRLVLSSAVILGSIALGIYGRGRR
jgi:drug/metabolite transporter (DMT)-like permease